MADGLGKFLAGGFISMLVWRSLSPEAKERAMRLLDQLAEAMARAEQARDARDAKAAVRIRPKAAFQAVLAESGTLTTAVSLVA